MNAIQRIVFTAEVIMGVGSADKASVETVEFNRDSRTESVRENGLRLGRRCACRDADTR